MIAPLRRRHLTMTVVLALVVPALYVTALVTRPDTPMMTSVPPTLESESLHDGAIRWSEPVPFAALPAATVRVGRGPEGHLLALNADGPLPAPDVLVYWTPEAPPADAESLPAAARFLGAWDGRPRHVAAPGIGGGVWLYSLAHRRLVAGLPLPAGAAP